MFAGILAAIAEKVASVLIEKIDEKLTIYFETKSKLSVVSKEAKELDAELENANSVKEYQAIIRKIDKFADNFSKLS